MAGQYTTSDLANSPCLCRSNLNAMTEMNYQVLETGVIAGVIAYYI